MKIQGWFEQWKVRTIFETEYCFNLLQQVSTDKIHRIGTIKVPIGTNNWDVETYNRNKLDKLFISCFFYLFFIRKCHYQNQQYEWYRKCTLGNQRQPPKRPLHIVRREFLQPEKQKNKGLTSKNETTNSPIHEFKVLQNVL